MDATYDSSGDSSTREHTGAAWQRCDRFVVLGPAAVIAGVFGQATDDVQGARV